MPQLQQVLERGGICPRSKDGHDRAAQGKDYRQQHQNVIIEMEPEMHDKVFAAVSHLPHAAAYAMVNTVSGLDTGSEEYLRFSGAGFRDFTRIAASSPEMWRDICLLNGENIAQMIERYQFHLNRIRKAVIARDGAKLLDYFTEASTARRAL